MKYQFGLPILVLALTATFSVGCMKLKKKEEVTQKMVTDKEQTDDEKSEQIVALSPSSVKIKYYGQHSPNQYTAELSWPNSTTKSIYRIIGDKNVSTETTANSLILNQLNGGNEIKIIIEQYDIATQKRLASFDVIVSPPADYVFDGVVSLVENLEKNVERLFFTANAKVYTNQFNLKITAKNIYSEFGAVLSNFPEGSVANVDVTGLSGGKTELNADQATGNLVVILNAQKGGAGKLGTPAGSHSEYGFVMTNPEIFKTTPPDYPICYGDQGIRSGNSGSLLISVVHSDDFQLSTQMKIIAGGDPGGVDEKCYLGQLYMDKVSPGKYCRATKNLATCNQKTPAESGQPGKPGQICTKMNANENFKCEKF